MVQVLLVDLNLVRPKGKVAQSDPANRLAGKKMCHRWTTCDNMIEGQRLSGLVPDFARHRPLLPPQQTTRPQSKTCRLFITMATLFTYPLAMQPVASIFSQALIQAGFGEPTSSSVEGKYGAVGSEESGDVQLAVDAESNEKHLPPPIYYGLRAGLVLFTGVCATSVPNFGVVVSLLGSFAVTLGSFVLPPLFHMAVFGDRLTQKEMAADIALFVVGVATCIFCTATTAIGVFNGDD